MLQTAAGKHFVLLLTLLQDSFEYVLQVNDTVFYV